MNVINKKEIYSCTFYTGFIECCTPAVCVPSEHHAESGLALRLQVHQHDTLGDHRAAFVPFQWRDVLCLMECVVLILKILLRLVAQNLVAMLVDVDLHFFGHQIDFPNEEVIEQIEKIFYTAISAGNVKRQDTHMYDLEGIDQRCLCECYADGDAHFSRRCLLGNFVDLAVRHCTKPASSGSSLLESTSLTPPSLSKMSRLFG